MDKMDLRHAAAFATTMVAFGFTARAGAMLWGGAAEQPPADPGAYDQWQRRRKWLLWSELSALPGFAALTVLLPSHLGWSPVAQGLFGLALGSFGYQFVVRVAKALIERRLGVAHGD